jgi:putative FmdB family regulatory protein
MPLYDYQCQHCGAETEAFQHMNDTPLRRCGECRHHALVRLIGATSIRTTATAFRGRGTLLQQCGNDEAELGRLVGEAKRQGYTPRDTDIYEPGLADRKGDPKAFIPSADPVAGLKRACKLRGTGCDGPIKIGKTSLT